MRLVIHSVAVILGLTRELCPVVDLVCCLQSCVFWNVILGNGVATVLHCTWYDGAICSLATYVWEESLVLSRAYNLDSPVLVLQLRFDVTVPRISLSYLELVSFDHCTGSCLPRFSVSS